jgi:hypothetical protein
MSTIFSGEVQMDEKLVSKLPYTFTVSCPGGYGRMKYSSVSSLKTRKTFHLKMHYVFSVCQRGRVKLSLGLIN